MKRQFAALRFSADANLSDRLYWYLTDFPVKEGDEVLAPVGIHDRLQRAIVERTLTAEEGEAPYDIRLCKHIASPLGDRKRTAGGVDCLEFGGIRYDEKHYTRFHRLLVSEEIPSAPLNGVLAVSPSDMGVSNALHTLVMANSCVLFYGAGAKELGMSLVRFARGEEALSLTEEEMRQLAEKLL